MPAIASEHNFRIRTITAGVPFNPDNGLKDIEEAFAFLSHAREMYVNAGYEVQTIRIATQALAKYLPDWKSDASIKMISELDRFAVENKIAFNLGPVITDDHYDKEFAAWAAEIIAGTKNISFTVHATSDAHGIHPGAIRSAAEAMHSIARAKPGGEGNFNFSATAYAPPGTPFYPAAYHEGKPAFSVGLESPRLLEDAFKEVGQLPEAGHNLKIRMQAALKPLEVIAQSLSQTKGLRYLGLDVSPAPGPDASIGRAIETLTGMPFGDISTLSACAAITDVLKALDLKTCGYSGLMLPPMEDAVLAKRAAEGRYNISELLLYSSVCGTGLDVVPLPGDTTAKQLESVIWDVASLAKKYKKPLAARLLPIPGKKAGDMLHYDNPVLTDSMVMNL